MIELFTNNGVHEVVLTCDVCLQRITDAKMAMVRWHRSEESGPSISNLFYSHKGECDKAVPARRGDPWMELSHFIVRLVYTCGMDEETIRDGKDSVSRLNAALLPEAEEEE